VAPTAGSCRSNSPGCLVSHATLRSSSRIIYETQRSSVDVPADEPHAACVVGRGTFDGRVIEACDAGSGASDLDGRYCESRSGFELPVNGRRYERARQHTIVTVDREKGGVGMATRWFIDTSASKQDLVQAFGQVFFTRPSVGTRLKIWSKAAQLQSNLRWEQTAAPDALVAARMVSGGLREAVADSKRGPGSGLGTTVAMAVHPQGNGSQAQLWLANYNTAFGMNQQSDVIKSYSKQVAARLVERGHQAQAHK
jgi:hypothetical protein